jgi:hypothetical protein
MIEIGTEAAAVALDQDADTGEAPKRIVARERDSPAQGWMSAWGARPVTAVGALSRRK